MDSSCSKTLEKCYNLRFYYFWSSSYCNVLFQMAAILDLPNMAVTGGAKLGFLEKMA